MHLFSHLRHRPFILTEERPVASLLCSVITLHKTSPRRLRTHVMRVLVSDKFPTEGLQVLEQAEGIELDYQPGLTTEQLIEAVAEADALIVRSGTQVTEEVFQAANKLKVVGRAGVGTSNLDLDSANRKGRAANQGCCRGRCADCP